MFCTKCGWELPDDAEFCGMCGTRVSKIDGSDSGREDIKKSIKKQSHTGLIVGVTAIAIFAVGIGSVALWKNSNRLSASNSSASVVYDSTGDGTYQTGVDRDSGKTSGDYNDISDVGNSIIKEQENHMSYFEKMFSNAPRVAYDDNDKAGYIDINGNYVISPQFNFARAFSEELAAVKDSETGLWGYIDLSGEYVISPKYFGAGSFKDGYAVVSLDSHSEYGVINKQGNYVIEPIYDGASYFKEGYALVKDPESDMYKYIDESGNDAPFGTYYKAYLFDNGRAVVCEDGAHGGWKILKDDGDYEYFDVNIDWFRSFRAYGDYTLLSLYIDFTDGYPVRTIDGQYVMVDEYGRAISPYFDYLEGFSGDYSKAGQKVDGKMLYGYVDKNFNWTIEPQYEEAYNFLPDYAMVQKVREIDYKNYDSEYERDHLFDSWVVIDKNGNEILDGAEHNGIKLCTMHMNSLRDGIPTPASRRISDDPAGYVYGYVNINYQEVLPFIYEEVDPFASDGSYAIVKYNGKYGMIDQSGNWLIEAKFNSLDSKKVY